MWSLWDEVLTIKIVLGQRYVKHGKQERTQDARYKEGDCFNGYHFGEHVWEYKGPAYGLCTKEDFTVICSDDYMSWIETRLFPVEEVIQRL